MTRAAAVAIIIAAVFVGGCGKAPEPVVVQDAVLQAVQVAPGNPTLVLVAFQGGYCAAFPWEQLQSRSWTLGKPHRLAVSNAGGLRRAPMYWLVASKPQKGGK